MRLVDKKIIFLFLKAVDEFLRVQNWSSSDAKCWNIAVKFLMARKFDVDRAVKLYAEHDVILCFLLFFHFISNGISNRKTCRKIEK